MLLSKYCRNRSFLDIDPKQSCSHGWRGILVGRDLLNLKLGKIIGSGRITNIWREPWTAIVSTEITTGPFPLHTENWNVADLFVDNKPVWDVTRVQSLFPNIWKEILLIKPSSTETEDMYMWTETKDGEYSTRTRYFTAMD